MQLQDAIPTHTAILCQKLALNCLQEHYPLDNLLGTHNTAAGRSVSPDAAKLHRAREHYSAWAQGTIATLEGARAALWPVLQPLGTVYTKGAFYFLVPVPERVSVRTWLVHTVYVTQQLKLHSPHISKACHDVSVPFCFSIVCR